MMDIKVTIATTMVVITTVNVIIIKVSGLKASIDAALGRIFEIDGQNAEEEARWKSSKSQNNIICLLIIPSHHLITIIIMIMIGLVIIKNMKQMMDFFLEFSSNLCHQYHGIPISWRWWWSWLIFRDPESPHSGAPLLPEVSRSSSSIAA